MKNNFELLYNKAIKVLAKFDQTEGSMRQKLKVYSLKLKLVDVTNDIEDVISKLKSQNYINDERLLKRYINHFTSQNLGPEKVKQKLISKKFNRDLIQEYYDLIVSNINQSEVAQSLIQKKAAQLSRKDLSVNVLKNKLFNHLKYKGLDSSVSLNEIDTYLESKELKRS
jgi:SOS response regulatory protein OraA/RecX